MVWRIVILSCNALPSIKSCNPCEMFPVSSIAMHRVAPAQTKLRGLSNKKFGRHHLPPVFICFLIFCRGSLCMFNVVNTVHEGRQDLTNCTNLCHHVSQSLLQLCFRAYLCSTVSQRCYYGSRFDLTLNQTILHLTHSIPTTYVSFPEAPGVDSL